MDYLKSVLIGLCALLLLCMSAATMAQEIPPGVQYKKTSDGINQQAKAKLEAALAAKPNEVN